MTSFKLRDDSVVYLFQGSYVVTRLRPVDQLRQLMLNNSGPDCREVENFFRLHKVCQKTYFYLFFSLCKNGNDKSA